jgi:cytidylate kinase
MIRVITIARQVGTWGDYIGVNVAKQLDWRFLDRELVAEAAHRTGITEKSLRNLETGPGILRRLMDNVLSLPKRPQVNSQAMRFSEFDSLETLVDQQQLSSLTQHGFSRKEAFRHAIAMNFPQLHQKHDFASLIKPVILEFADKGNVILAGSGAQMFLRDRQSVLHVLFIAPEEKRIQAIMEQESVNVKIAEKRVKEVAESRQAYFRKHFGVDNWMDSSLYDLVINTGKITKDVAVDMIIKAAQSL